MQVNLQPAIFLFSAGLMAAGATLPAANSSSAGDVTETRAKPPSEHSDLALQVRQRLHARLPELAKRVEVEQRDDVIVLTGAVDSLPENKLQTRPPGAFAAWRTSIIGFWSRYHRGQTKRLNVL